jgi:hypothetical protein
MNGYLKIARHAGDKATAAPVAYEVSILIG